MISLPLRARLTLWYSCLLAATLGTFTLLSFEEMRRTLLVSIDAELRNDLEETRRAIVSAPISSVPARFARHDRDLFQIIDHNGFLVFETSAARTANPPAPSADHCCETVRAGGVQFRAASTTLSIGNTNYRVRYWLPLRQYEQSVDRFGLVVLLSIPAVLLIGAGGGAWMSRRALRPVDRIIRDARAITARNLDRRLEIPRSRDELQELSLTLNDMFDRLEQAFRRVTEFTADASHELRTPVALMRTSAEVALRNPRTVEEYQDVLSSIHDELRSMSQLIDDLLVLARSDAGTEALEMSTIDLGEPLRTAVMRLTPLALAKQIRLHAELPQSPIPIDGNESALLRLFS
ncbi:MAG TPA: histidine kinase dimerization/phospho-acceptor domain-containing protein, partial [Thermoanaerobaculia bacterium]|nr:histidine kinase dimerization/phospho-acceptor domain-containing protein [Thermoanaerobaculia bacterium]